MDQGLLDILACPRDHTDLRFDGKTLTCENDHVYPVIDGVPVMLLDDVQQTQWVASASIEKSGENGHDPLADEFPFADTIGITPEEYQQLLQMRRDGGGIDPVVQMSIARTCGHLYLPLVGNLKRYPIPELRMPPGNGKLFLDVGCNWGRWCIAAARLGYDPVGIDPSLGSVFTARRVCAELGIKARFVVGDGRYLPFKPGAFDVSFSYSVLQHFSKADARQALREMARTLRPGGDGLVQLPNFYGIRCLFNNARRGFSEGVEFDVRFWRPKEMKRAFREYFGPTRFSVDGFFGLGIQESDVDLLPSKYQTIVRCSRVLRRASQRVPLLTKMADSLYVHAIRESPNSAT